jgi:hypothetical protein
LVRTIAARPVPRQVVSRVIVRSRLGFGGLSLVVTSIAAFVAGWLIGYLSGVG